MATRIIDDVTYRKGVGYERKATNYLVTLLLLVDYSVTV